jgi:putative transcriptional regulator
MANPQRKECPDMRSTALAAVFIFLLGWSPVYGAEDLSQPLILVAKPQLRHPLYSSSILVVKPFGVRQHIGFIVNRPTDFTLGKIFPDHGPSQKVSDPIYLGGPVDAQAIFALVHRPDTPGGNSIEIMPGLFAVLDAATVDKIIETDPGHARFVAGLVVWRPGELEREIKQGAWFLHDADAKLAMREPKGLWEELVRKSDPSGGGRSGKLLRTSLDVSNSAPDRPRW